MRSTRNQRETRQLCRKASRAGSSFLGKALGPPWAFRPYRGIDGEGPLPVACRDVKGEQCIAATVSVAGQDAGDEAGDGAVLTDGDVHGEVQQHRVIVVDVQHPNPHQHLGMPGEEEEEVTEKDKEKGGMGDREERGRKSDGGHGSQGGGDE